VASDAESGLASDPSATVPINTESAGPQKITRTAIDNVGHETTRSCTTQVRESPPEYGRCLAVAGEQEAGKTVFHGMFTTSACTAESTTRTGKYEWFSGVAHTGFKESSTTQVTFESVKKTKWTCAGEKATGVITSAKTIGSLTLTFTGCTTAGSTCTTAGHPAGELETKKLEGVLGITRTTIKEGKETRYVGLDISPTAKAGALIEFACGEAGTPYAFSGSVIEQVTANKMGAALGSKFVQSAGKQNPESFLGGEKDVLKTAKGEQVGLKVTVTDGYEEALEINAFF
jgi:hypothetical protein